jgi:hypothetical protein
MRSPAITASKRNASTPASNWSTGASTKSTTSTLRCARSALRRPKRRPRKCSRRAALARDAARQIAASAARQLRTLTRTSWLRAVSAAVVIGLVGFVTGVALGRAWGSGSTARTVGAADATVRWVAAEEGPAAVKDWDTLMRSNPIEFLMAGCTEANLAVEGRKGCRMRL